MIIRNTTMMLSESADGALQPALRDGVCDSHASIGELLGEVLGGLRSETRRRAAAVPTMSVSTAPPAPRRSSRYSRSTHANLLSRSPREKPDDPEGLVLPVDLQGDVAAESQVGLGLGEALVDHDRVPVARP